MRPCSFCEVMLIFRRSCLFSEVMFTFSEVLFTCLRSCLSLWGHVKSFGGPIYVLRSWLFSEVLSILSEVLFCLTWCLRFWSPVYVSEVLVIFGGLVYFEVLFIFGGPDYFGGPVYFWGPAYFVEVLFTCSEVLFTLFEALIILAISTTISILLCSHNVAVDCHRWHVLQ